MIGPSYEVHCDPCLFQKLDEHNISTQLQLLEAHTVKIFAGRLAANEGLNLPAPETTPPTPYMRHQAAAKCATTIVSGSCPLFVYAENAAGHKTVHNRPPEMEGFEGLKSVK